MMKHLIVPVLCALVVGCGGGSGVKSSEGIDSSLEAKRVAEVLEAKRVAEVLEAKRVAETLEANRVAEALPGALFLPNLGLPNEPFESYLITRGVLTRNSGVDIDPPSTDGLIVIPNWTGKRFISKPELGSLDEFTDRFVIYTNSESPTDDSYLDFGYWIRDLERMDGGVSTRNYQIVSFVTGAPLSKSENMTLVMGSATYSGPATGLYAKKTGSIFTTSGQFKANATLSVDFGIEDPLVDKIILVQISGSVTKFRDIAGNLIDPNWTVELLQAEHDSEEIRTGRFEHGVTSGGGKWRYLYFGELDNTDPIDPTVQPEMVGGTFTETFSNGEVAGAFAATKE